MSRFAQPPVSWHCYRQVLALLLLCLFAGLAQAQSADIDDSADPPTRVARLSYIGGELGFLPSGATDWSDARINRPLTNGDQLSSAADARAELEFDGATLRIDGRTELGLLDLDDQLARVELTQGSLSITVRRLGEGESYEVDTPAVALVMDLPGTFRVDVDPRDGSTRVAALGGAATVFGENNAQRSINPGRSYRFADASLGMVTITDIRGGDAFDRWASERDNRYARSDSRQYVSDDVVGYQDLDQYGAWQDSSEYGAVWYPRNVGSDWAPYRNGHWAYIAPWGWTWIDDAPWGYAPYHYGRWAHTQRGWGWIPGPRGVRAIYAPALVAFVGGSNWSVGIGSTPVGWFPLGPGDIYNPWYRCGRRYYTNVNLHNIRARGGRDPRRGIDDHYNRYRRGDFGHGGHRADGHAPRGVTAVSRRNFGEGRNVKQNRVRVDPRKLVDAPLRTGDINRLRPIGYGNHASRTRHVRNLPAGGFNRAVVGRRASMARRDGDRPRHPGEPQAQLPAIPTITPAAPRGSESPTHDGAESRPNRVRRGESRRAATPGLDAGARFASPVAVPAFDPVPRPQPPARRNDPRPPAHDRGSVPRDLRPVQAAPVRSTPRPRPQRASPPSYQGLGPMPRQPRREPPPPRPRPSAPAPQRYQPPQRSAPAPRAEAPRPRQNTQSQRRKDLQRLDRDPRQP